MGGKVRIAIVVAMASLAIVSAVNLRAADRPASKPSLGINLNGPADWNTELPFVDVFRFSRPWISQREGQPWGKGPELELDERGWVKRLEADCWAETLLCTIEGGHYPAGRYAVLYDGQGELDVWNAATIVDRRPGRLAVDVDPSKGAFYLRLLKTDPNDYVRNIRVIMPGFETTWRKDPFHPVFLERWQGVTCLRFMDWMETNGSEISRWSQRPRLDDATFSKHGVAVEVMIDLANRLGADPWFCMPHRADDEYIRNFARLVRQRLDGRRKVYVEYSNEVWNGQFPQSKYAGEEGIKLGFAEKPWEAAWRFTAHRSVQIFRIWEEAMGGRDRLVRILPSQAANPYVSERILEFQDACRSADALAIAPYVSFNIPRQGKGLTTADVEKWTVEQVLDHVQQESLPKAIEWIKAQKQVADKYGLKLVAYEAGQHLVGVGGGENNDKVTALLQAANAHPRMGRIYDQYYATWTEAGGDLLCYFSSVGRWSKWGSWGILEHYDDDPRQSPKFMSTMRWAKSLGQEVHVPE